MNAPQAWFDSIRPPSGSRGHARLGENLRGPGVTHPGPPRERKESWGGPAFSGECPQVWAVPSPPPEGVKKTWGGPAFSCEGMAPSAGVPR